MMVTLPLYVLFFALYSSATPLNIVVQDPNTMDSYKVWLSTSPEQLHQSLLIKKKSLARLSPLKPVSFITKKIDIAGQSIVRSTPMIDGVITEGIDGILTNDQQHNQFYYTHFTQPKDGFRLNAAECMERALVHQEYALIRDPYVENINGMYEAIWLMHFGELRPAFKLRPPTLSVFDLKDIYIDADNGQVLRIDDAAQLDQAPANLFVYSPHSSNLEADLKSVILTNLVKVEDNGFLQGEYVNVRTCCKYFTCPESGTCVDAEKKCALKSHENAQEYRELLELPTDSLGLDPLLSLPSSLFVDTVRCTYLPFARLSFKNDQRGVVGFYEKPIDNSEPESEMDRFSEIQAYYSISSFFNHIRTLLDNPNWCLRAEAMSCNPDGSPVLDELGNPKNPYKVFVNQMIPDMKMDGRNRHDSDNFLSQIMAGKGSRDNPIKLDQFARVGNAAFVPALSTLKKNTPRADEILSDLIKPYDHNVFFQGERDFAYDGDVVFHEFMHAITTSLIGKLNNLGLDKWGIHSEPGALNEGFADYFAASFTNKSTVGEYASTKDGFGEASLRNIDNNASCPNDVIGESHNDSLIWSGALWEIRSALIKSGLASSLEFDRAVLASLAQATITEDFKIQSEKLITTMKNRPALGEKAALIATNVFAQRGINDCYRAYTLSTVNKNNQLSSRTKNLLFVPSKNQIGLKNYAPATSQLEIGIPASAKSLTISWRQFLGGNGALLGREATPNTTKNIEPLGVITSTEVPITWKFNHARAIPTRLDQEITDAITKASYRNGYWQASIPLNFSTCEQKTMYVSLLSNDFKYVLENIQISFDTDTTKNLSTCDFPGSRRITKNSEPIGCSTKTSHHGMWATLLLLLALRNRTRCIA
jgi:hypothetical protein